MAAVLLFFWRDLWRIAVDLGRARWYSPGAARQPRRPHGLVPHLRHDPDRGLRAAVLRPDRDRCARPAPHRLGAHPVRRRPVGSSTGSSPQRKEIEDLNLRDGMLFGFAQSLALIPGVSRSGSTITAGRALGYTRESRGPVLVPAVGPRRRALGAVRGAQARRRRRPGVGPHDRRDASSPSSSGTPPSPGCCAGWPTTRCSSSRSTASCSACSSWRWCTAARSPRPDRDRRQSQPLRLNAR